MKRARKVASPQGTTMVALPDGLLISSPRGQFILRTTASDPNFEIEDQDSSEIDDCTPRVAEANRQDRRGIGPFRLRGPASPPNPFTGRCPGNPRQLGD
jgi:hypothetical protein